MSTHVVTLDGFARELRKLPKTAERAMVRGLRSAALRTQGQVVVEIDTAKPYPAVDRGTLRRSVGVDNHPDGALLSVDAPYAAAMEYGTRPFFPPLAPLEEWVQRKGLAGKKPRFSMRKAEREGGGLGKLDFMTRKEVGLNRHQQEIKSIAYAIALKISKEGIEPRHFFAKAMAKVPGFLRVEIDKELEKL